WSAFWCWLWSTKDNHSPPADQRGACGKRGRVAGREAQHRGGLPGADRSEPAGRGVARTDRGDAGAARQRAGLIGEDAWRNAAQGRTVGWGVMRPGRRPIEALGRALREFGLAEPPDGDWASLLRTPEDLNHLLATPERGDRRPTRGPAAARAVSSGAARVAAR